MVRLLLVDELPKALSIPQFQSHNGAIAAQLQFPATNFPLQFQSHNGAIAAVLNNQINNAYKGFNPTMVRLLPRQNFGV